MYLYLHTPLIVIPPFLRTSLRSRGHGKCVHLVLPAASSAQILPGVLSVATTVTVFLDPPLRARWTLPSAHCRSAHTTQPQTNLPDCQPRLDCQASPRDPAVPHCTSFLSFVAVQMSRGC